MSPKRVEVLGTYAGGLMTLVALLLCGQWTLGAVVTAMLLAGAPSAIKLYRQ